MEIRLQAATPIGDRQFTTCKSEQKKEPHILADAGLSILIDYNFNNQGEGWQAPDT